MGETGSREAKKEIMGILASVTESRFFSSMKHRLAEDRLLLGGSAAPVAF